MSRSGKQESSERSSRFWRRSSICSGKKCTIQAWKRYIARYASKLATCNFRR
ncbi:hypothetical protein OIU79_015924 [Salix purpurea]|uniref:Uncharacterized protein n=1 Tax=Salix purpurea TaxID=77065 RepID=A0A9Q0PD01_SALPP|nr:hypothetical protein OIU79_015924 [Salix purpurea]